MKRITALGVLLTMAWTFTGCQVVGLIEDGGIVKEDGGDVIYVAENQGGFDAEPGDQIIVIMYLDGNDPTDRCEQMNGTISWSHRVAYCGADPDQPVDF